MLVRTRLRGTLALDPERGLVAGLTADFRGRLAQPAVAWVDANLGNGRKADYSRAYLQYLFTGPGQEIIAKAGYRPIDPKIQTEYAGTFPDITLFPVTAVAKDWVDAQTKFFGPDGIVSVVAAPHQGAMHATAARRTTARDRGGRLAW